MKNFLFLASSILLLLAASCQKEEPVIPLESIELNHTQLELGLNEQCQLVATASPAEATYKDLVWNSTDPKIASVTSNGLVTTYSQTGMVMISVEHKAQTSTDVNLLATCTLTVKDSSADNPEGPVNPDDSTDPNGPNNPGDSTNPDGSDTPGDPSKPEKVTSFNETVNGVTFNMIGVEGGTFQMGATAEQGDDADSDEKPVHTVNLSSFYLSKTEVTQAQYKAVMGENPSYFNGDNLPVEQVSWYDAQAFCEKLSQLTGKNYVLPTEAQWEYAARGGKQNEGTKYAGSNNVDEVAWYWDNSNSQTHPVATKAPNALGLYDMSGNVWEWCADWNGDYSAAAQTNPTGPETGVNRIIRGGSWGNYAGDTRVSIRDYYNPLSSYYDNGFRVALLP